MYLYLPENQKIDCFKPLLKNKKNGKKVWQNKKTPLNIYRGPQLQHQQQQIILIKT